MLSLVVIDMQQWMFRYPERAAQIPSLVANINALLRAFSSASLPIFNVEAIQKADRTTWSRLMLKYDYPCLIEGTDDVRFVDGYAPPESAIRIVKTANSAFLGTDFASALGSVGTTELVLTGVFMDGCVGLTAADAAQRRFEVTLVDDAIGHAEAHHRTPIRDWLVKDYEFGVVSTEQMLGRLREQFGATPQPT
jgi:nicotinamidase-related amidase